MIPLHANGLIIIHGDFCVRRRAKGERGRERGGDREREREMRWREMRCVMLYRGEKREREAGEIFFPLLSHPLYLSPLSENRGAR